MATEKVLVLRTCSSNLTSHNGFVWPSSGHVHAPDWNPAPVCGQGLHGLLWGEGNGSLLNWDPNAKWLVVEVDAHSCVNLDGKVKFPAGTVVFCGSRLDATNFILARAPANTTVVGATVTAGHRGTATAGHYGTATAGKGGTATAGYGGILQIYWWDNKVERRRLAVAYVGENGIKPNIKYKLDDSGNFIEA